jgi:hypothetical protein
MDKNVLGQGREIPLDDEGLQDMLAGGPSVPVSGAKPDLPPPPEPKRSSSKEVEASESSLPIEGEGPDEELKKSMILPSESEQAALQSKYGELKVVPIPYTRSDGKIQTYILKRLTRSQWRTAEEKSLSLANAKGISPDEIFKEKVVCQAVVWPHLEEHDVSLTPPGLVPTLYGVIEQMGCFFNPDAIMSVSFNL